MRFEQEYPYCSLGISHCRAVLGGVPSHSTRRAMALGYVGDVEPALLAQLDIPKLH